jgi:hypothetical protein
LVAASGVLKEAALGFAVRARTSRAAMGRPRRGDAWRHRTAWRGLGFCGAGSVADTGGARFCSHVAERGQARRGDVGHASEGGAAGTQAKGLALSLPCHGAEAEALRGRGWRWKGKLTSGSGSRLSAARERGKGTRRRRLAGWAVLAWAVPAWAVLAGKVGKGAGPGCAFSCGPASGYWPKLAEGS